MLSMYYIPQERACWAENFDNGVSKPVFEPKDDIECNGTTDNGACCTHSIPYGLWIAEGALTKLPQALAAIVLREKAHMP